MEWIRFSVFLFRQDEPVFAEASPHYPNDPVDPVQLFIIQYSFISLLPSIVALVFEVDGIRVEFALVLMFALLGASAMMGRSASATV